MGADEFKMCSLQKRFPPSVTGRRGEFDDAISFVAETGGVFIMSSYVNMVLKLGNIEPDRVIVEFLRPIPLPV